MEEFIKNNKTILIICAVFVFSLIISIILSAIVRKSQVRKNLRKEIEYSKSFKEYDVKTINVNDVDISKVQKPLPPNSSTTPPNNIKQK